MDKFFETIEANRQIKRIEVKELQNERNLPIPLPERSSIAPPLDESLLPNAWRVWLADTADRLQCPLDFPTIPALISSAAIIGNRIRIRPKRLDSWLVVPNLWGAVVGTPGVMKTPAVSEGLFFLKEIAEKERLIFEARKRDDEFEKRYREQRKSDIIKEMKKATLSRKQELREQFISLEIEEPKEKRLWTSDVTVEKLGELLNENPSGILIQRDELTGWFRMLDRSGHEQDRAFYLESWNGEGAFIFDRIGRGQTHIKNLTVSIIGTIQPAMIEPYLRGSLEGYGDDGLIQRYQLLVFPEIPSKFIYKDQQPIGREIARDSFKNLYAMTPKDIGAKQLTNDGGGHYFLQFDEEAQEYFQEWLTDLETSLRSGAFEIPAMESHLSKYRSLMPSLALIFHLLDRVINVNEKSSISLASVELASAWCSYLQKHAEKLYQFAQLSEFDCAKEILKRIETGQLETEFTARDIYSKHWKRLNRENTKKGLEILVDYNYLTSVRLETRGAPKIVYTFQKA